MTAKFFIYFTLFGIFLLVTGGMLGFKIFPDLIHRKIWENTVLKENTTQWDIFIKLPFPLIFKVYFFNVTNSKNIIQEGEKPLVQEVGPYVYNEFKTKSDIDRNSEGTVYFREHLHFEFDQNASETRSDTDELTILNVPLNSVIQIAENKSLSLLSTLNFNLPFIFYNYTDIFFNVPVKEYLFSGIEICRKDNIEKATFQFAAGIICNQLKVKAKTARSLFLTADSINFANFYDKNSTPSGYFGIKSGEKNKEDYGKMAVYNKLDRMDVWQGEKSTCNKIKGYSEFPPLLKPNSFLELFNEDLCRTVFMDFITKTSYKGIDGYEFKLRKNTFSPRGQNKCYCLPSSRGLNGNHSCPDGLLDLSNCAGAPVFASFPHLLWVDEEIRSSVDGLRPDADDHTSYVLLEINTGVPLKVSKKVQFNMFIRPIPNIDLSDNLTNAIIPILWVEESMELPEEYVKMLKENLIYNLKKVEIFKWGSIAAGVFATAVPIGCMLYYLK